MRYYDVYMDASRRCGEITRVALGTMSDLFKLANKIDKEVLTSEQIHSEIMDIALSISDGLRKANDRLMEVK